MDIIPAAKANIMLDMSNFDLFQLCKKRFHYRVNLRRSLPVIQKNRALDLGGLAHKGFEKYYKLLAEGVSFTNRIDAAVLHMRTTASNPDESNLDVEEVEFLIKVVIENLDYWRSEDEFLRILAVEAPFAFTLYEDENIRIIISGMIDLLVDKPALGGSPEYLNLPIDHKTYSRDSQVLRLSNQFMCYCVAAGSNYLIVNRVGLQKTVKPDEKYKRPPMSYDPEILQQWKDNVIAVILEEYAACISTGKWTMNTTSCLKFNRLCEYYEVCESSGEDAKEHKLMNNYFDMDPWDVTRKMED